MKNKISRELLDKLTTEELEEELNRQKYKFRYKKLLRSTIHILLVVVALSILISTLVFPVLKIYGESMESTLNSGDIVVCFKKSEYKHGDVVAFYYNNQVLVKRIVALSSDWVDIDNEGNLYINDKLIDEPYIESKSYGESDISYPYQVPEESYFVLGDKRENSVDSRNSLIGTITNEEIIGKIIFKVWPVEEFGIVNNY